MKPQENPTRLVRGLGPWAGVAVVAGTVIGSGVFKKPQAVAEAVEFSGLIALVWIACGLLVMLGALAYGEVAVLYPRAGGNYVFLREAYGRMAGFLWGWVEFWIIRSASLAALATIFTESLAEVLGNAALHSALGLSGDFRPGYWPQKLITVGVLAALGLVNIRGVRWGGGLQILITSVKVLSLLAIAALPFLILFLARHAPDSAAEPNVDRLHPIWPSRWSEISVSGLGAAMLGVLWAYHGWMNITPVAEEVKSPQRNLPLALIVGVGLVITLYLGANLAYALVIPRVEMAHLTGTTTATEFSLRLLGPLGAAAASAAIMTSVFGALNGNLLVGPRLLYAMAADKLAPSQLAQLHPRYNTPALAIIVLTAWSSILVLGVAALTESGVLDPNKSAFDRLTDFAMFGSVVFETLAVLSIFVFRFRRPDADRPYRCPGYPLTPLLYLLLPGFVLVNMLRAQSNEAAAGVGFILLGVVVYLSLGLGRLAPAPQPPASP